MAAGDRPHRLFVAIDVPEEVRLLVEHAIDPIRARYPQARWVPEANQHVTVRFLGSTPAEQVTEVLARVRGVAASRRAFATRAAGIGAFPSTRRARVLWVGLEDPEGRAAEIATALDAALAPEFEPDPRPFVPHLTVARFDPPVRLEDDVAALGVESVPFTIDAITVYRSHLGRPAPRYEALASYPLGE